MKITTNTTNIKVNNWFNQKEKKLLWQQFLFPYFPLKFFKSIQLISFLALLLALHIILVYVGFFLPIINIQIGFDWIPTYLAGWFFGPIIGPIFGFIANNISWLQTGAMYWYWMYAIQEPIIALFASLVSFYFNYSKNKNSLVTDWIIYQIVLSSVFLVAIILMVYFYVHPIKNQWSEQKVLYPLFVGALSVLCIFYFLSQFFTIYFAKKKKNNYQTKIYMSASIIVLCVILVFAITAGAYTNVKWLIVFNMISTPKPFGILLFNNMIIQVLTESIRTPMAILILYLSLGICIKPFEKIKASVYYIKEI